MYYCFAERKSKKLILKAVRNHELVYNIITFHYHAYPFPSEFVPYHLLYL